MAWKLEDNSLKVKAELNDITIAWLHKWGNEVASQAKRNCQMTDDHGQLRKSYRAMFDDGDGVAEIGSPLESAYWEEFGTGSHADTGSNGGREGRKGWWVYTPGNDGPDGYTSNYYATKEEAESMAAYIRKRYKKEAVVTNGRDPSYTLQKAFEAVKNPAEADLERKLRGGMND